METGYCRRRQIKNVVFICIHDEFFYLKSDFASIHYKVIYCTLFLPYSIFKTCLGPDILGPV